jgi:hypothetical protein
MKAPLIILALCLVLAPGCKPKPAARPHKHKMVQVTPPLPTMSPRARLRSPAAALPPPIVSIWSWEIPGWDPYQFTPVNGRQPCTWLERITDLRDVHSTNWVKCTTNVPITYGMATAKAAVTNLPVYFLRSAFGWR